MTELEDDEPGVSVSPLPGALSDDRRVRAWRVPWRRWAVPVGAGVVLLGIAYGAGAGRATPGVARPRAAVTATATAMVTATADITRTAVATRTTATTSTARTTEVAVRTRWVVRTAPGIVTATRTVRITAVVIVTKTR